MLKPISCLLYKSHIQFILPNYLPTLQVHQSFKMMNYKQWNLVTKKEYQDVAIIYIDTKLHSKIKLRRQTKCLPRAGVPPALGVTCEHNLVVGDIKLQQKAHRSVNWLKEIYSKALLNKNGWRQFKTVHPIFVNL